MKEAFEKFYEKEVKSPAVGYFWKCLAFFLLGVVAGFLIAPIKKGIKMGCNNGNYNGNNSKASLSDENIPASDDIPTDDLSDDELSEID